MKATRHGSFSLALGAMLIAWGFSAASQAATVSLDPTTTTVGVGSAFQVNLDISGVNNATTPAVGAYDVTLSFDPALVAFQNASFGTQLDPSGQGDIQSVTPGASNVEVYEIALDSAQQLTASQSNSFTLASFSLYSLAAGTSALNLTLNGLSDVNGSPIAASVSGGSVTIGTTPVPLPPTIWLLCLALISMCGLRPRRKHVMA